MAATLIDSGTSSSRRTLIIRSDATRNALTPAMLVSLVDALHNPGDKAPAVVLTGHGDMFSSGYDTSDLATAPDEARALLADAVAAIEEYPMPVVAALRGGCVGAALELALACDIRIAAESAWFALPAARLGIVYPAPGVARLVSVVGTSWARYLLLGAQRLPGVSAATIGLVHRAVPEGELDHEVNTLVEEMGALAPLAVRGAKATINALVAQPAGLDDTTAAELDGLVGAALSSADHREALDAMRQRRQPSFSGR